MARTAPPAPNARRPAGPRTTDASASPSTATAPDGSATTADTTAAPGPLTDRLIAALELRGLDVELLVKLGVGASTRLRGDCIAIPYRQAGVTVNHKYRTIGGAKAFTQDAGAPQIFWNVDALADATMDGDPVIVTEGEFDAIAAMQCGFPRVVSVPGGAPSTELGDKAGAKYGFLDAMPGRERAPEIILAVDGDGPGANLMHDLARRIGRERCKWVKYPIARDPAKRGRERLKDLNEVLEDYGQAGVVKTLNGAQWLAVPGLYRMSDLPPLPEPAVYSTGIAGLDPHFRVRLGDFIVITGVPGFGKTTFVNEFTMNLARQHMLPVCYASFEQAPQREHRRNLRTLVSGKLVKWMTPEDTARADRLIEDRFSFIVAGDEDSPTIEWFLDRARAAVVRHGAKVIVLDPWNEMDHQRPTDMTLTEYVGDSIKALKRFARNYGVALVVVAHPAKPRRDRDGKFPVPSLYDISDSANWYNKADAGIVIHRDAEGALIKVVKARYSDIGTPGELRAVFNDQTLRFTVTEEPA